MQCLTTTAGVLSTYFNSEIVGDSVPYAETLRGICFRPVHYFCGGKTLSWGDKWYGYHLDKQKEKVSYPEGGDYNWQSTLKMAILIVPGMVVGTIAAIVAYAQSYFKDNSLPEEMLQNYQLDRNAAIDHASNFTAPDYELPADFDINASHQTLTLKWFDVLARLTSVEAWKDESIRGQFDALMTEAHKEMVLLFKDAAKRGGNDPKVMAQMMGKQFSYSQAKDAGPRYCMAFFYNSMGDIYSAARNHEAFEKTAEGYEPKNRDFNVADDAYSQPFFTPDTVEYKWRRLYNAVCALIDGYPGLRDALKEEENRFCQCARPDRVASDAYQGSFGWFSRPTL